MLVQAYLNFDGRCEEAIAVCERARPVLREVQARPR